MSLNSPKSEVNIESDLSLDDFVMQACESIRVIIAETISDEKKQELHTSFGLDKNLEFQDQDEEIYHHFLNNIPNIIAYSYKEVGDNMRPIIFSLAELYQEKTGEKFLNIDWKNRKRFPVTKLNEFIAETDLSDEYIYYLFGTVGFNRKYRSDKDTSREPKFSPAQLIQSSSLYRKKVLKNIEGLHHLEEAEYVRLLVSESLNRLYDVDTISNRDILEYLIQTGKDELKELKLEKKLEKEIEGASRKKEVEYRRKEREKKTKKIKDFLAELKNTNKKDVSDETEKLVNPDVVQGYKNRIVEQQRGFDTNGESAIEREIAQHVLSITSRFKKNETDDYSTEPSLFQAAGKYTCFSGTWFLASLLQQYGLEKDKLFYGDSFLTKYGSTYKHAYLLYKLANGKYIKIDYGFGQVYSTSTFDKEINNLEYGNSSSRVYMGNVDSDAALNLYRLEDGLSLMYLVGLMRKSLNEKDYDHILEICKVAKAIDPTSYHIHEHEGLAYENLGERDKAMSAYRKCLRMNSASATALFKLGEFLYEKGEKKEAKKYFKKLKKFTKDARKPHTYYIHKSDQYIKEIEAGEGDLESRIENFLELYSTDSNSLDTLDDNYLKFSIKEREKIIVKHIKNIETQEFNEYRLLFLGFILAIEGKRETSLFDRMGTKIKELLKTNGQQ